MWEFRAVDSMRRTEALASVKFYQILSIFIFFIRLIILEDFIRLISYNGPCVRLGCSFFLATVLELYSYIACVASVSVRFRGKERGTRVKDRAKNGVVGLSLLRNQTETLATQANSSTLLYKNVTRGTVQKK